MSKSKERGRPRPAAVATRDALRFFLPRIPYVSDGNISNEALIARINADLANTLQSGDQTVAWGQVFRRRLPS
jgi:methionyl-tRNA synthetase